MITTLFFIFVALVVFHFIYDGILAPSLRYDIKLKLFSMRDRVRRLKIDNDELVSDELFEFLQDDINKQIRLLHHLNLVEVAVAYWHTRDSNIEQRIKEIEEMIQSCEIKEIEEIYETCMMQVGRAVLANSGGWVIYCLPVILVCLMGFMAGSRLARYAAKILYSAEELTNNFGNPKGHMTA